MRERERELILNMGPSEGEEYRDNLYVKRRAHTVRFAHMGIIMTKLIVNIDHTACSE